MLRRNVNARNSFVGAGIVGALFATIFFLPVSVGATDTEIGVAVCGPDATGAQISISQPLNDSVQEQASTTFRGTVGSASQIEVLIDGSIDRTVAIAANQTDFAFDLTFTPGTHTITLRANDICGLQNGEDSIVMTYEPIPSPSSGGTTPTVVEGETTLEGEPVATQEIAAPGILEQIDGIPVFGPVVSAVIDLYSLTGLKQTMTSGDSMLATGIARVGLTVAAVSSVVLASSLAPVAMHVIPGLSEIFHASSHRSMMYLEWAIRGFGVLVMTIAYLL